MKYKPTYSLKQQVGVYAVQAVILLAPVGVFAQAQPAPCLGGALGIATNCSGSIGGNATLAPLTSSTRRVIGGAGNPVSASSFAVDSFFNNAVEITAFPAPTADSKAGTAAKESASTGRAAIEAAGALSYYDVDGTAVRRASLPLAYSIQPDIDPREKLTFRLPIARTTWGANQSSTSVGLGVDYRLPVTDAWSVVPAVSYTYLDADDLSGGKSNILALGATSIYNLDLEDGDSLAIANMLGYSSMRNNIDSSTTNNVMLRNGVVWAHPVELFNEKLGMQAFLIHTHYTSKDVVSQNYIELGFNLGTGKSTFATKDYWRAGLSFTKSDNTKGVTLTVGYWF